MRVLFQRKKTLAVLLSLTLLISLSAAALAAPGEGRPPEPPDGQRPADMPTPPDGQRPGDMPTPPDGQMPGGPGGMRPGGSFEADSYEAVTEYDADATVSGQSFASTGKDESAVWVSGGTVKLDGLTVSRASEDSTGGDNSSFYGVGAAVLATGGTAEITGSAITTDAAGGAGVFAYGDGVVRISDSTIATTQGTSGGIHAAGGGTVYASDLNVTTQGGSSAAIRSDRGGGLMVVDGGSYVASGSGSPAIYSTANIAVRDADLAATGSEAICIEGRNAIRLYDCDLTGSMPDDQRQNDCTWTVIVYQSMSGDSQLGCGTYQMSGGELTSTNGGVFYTTNTESRFILQDVDIQAAPDCEFFLRCTGNQNGRGWGAAGRNGAQCTFTTIDQAMTGDVVWDSVSELDFYMTQGSTLTGAFLDDESCAGEGGDGYAKLYISPDSTWTVTGDSVLTGLYNAGTVVDENGKTVTVQSNDGTVYVQGDSPYTVTVSAYDTSADLSGADAPVAWEDAQVNSASADIGTPGMPGESPAGAPAFSDVAPDAYYADSVRWAVKQGITRGTSDGVFSPDAICTRAQIVTFLWRSAGSPEPEGNDPFADVAEDAYYCKAALWAHEQGIVEGAAFQPEVPCTRMETVTLLWRAAGSPSAAAETSFTDVSADSDDAAAVAWAVEKGVTRGTSATTFSPDTVCTRAQIVTLLHRNFET